jgi:hypothetical protein
LDMSTIRMFDLLSSDRGLVTSLVESILDSVFMALVFVFLLFVVRVLLRRTWAAVAVFMILSAFIAYGQSSPVSFIYILITFSAMLFVFFRFGLLAVTACCFLFLSLIILPIPLRASWYAGRGLMGLALAFAFALYAFYTSLGGQPLFGRASLED